MTREEAIRRIKAWNLDSDDREVLAVIIPELAESEDERIRTRLIEYFQGFLEGHEDCYKYGGWVRWEDLDVKSILAWLEKQKEQKPTHFELKAGKWYICHRAFCCRADHLTVKEGERFMCEKDGVVKGFVIKEPEKYFKECSAPAPMEDEQKEPHYTKRNALFDKCVENCDPAVMKEVSDEVDEMLRKEQKPAEWSEEDEDMLNSCISSIEEAKENRYAYKETDGDTSYDHEIAFLKSLRPSWKLSEEQMRTLEDAFRKNGSDEYRKTINSLYQDLKKL